MQFDVFISYAWTNPEHKEWVRLLAAQLHAMGFVVGIDANVNYGDSLNGFMRKIKDAKHVLMIADESYANRAEKVSNSGVATECRALREVIDSKPAGWLAPLLIRNPEKKLPEWVAERGIKYFDFRSDDASGNYPGSEQIIDLWRWLADLSPDQSFAEDPAVIRKRMVRVEKVKELRDPGRWTLPYLSYTGCRFEYNKAPNATMTLGYGEFEFKLSVSECNGNSVYIYCDHIEAVGILPQGIDSSNMDADELYNFISPARAVTPTIGQTAVLLNREGCICTVQISDIVCEQSTGEYIPASITFDYHILTEQVTQTDSTGTKR